MATEPAVWPATLRPARVAAVGGAALAAFAAFSWVAVRTGLGQRTDENLFGLVLTSARHLHPVAAALRQGVPLAACVVVAVLTVWALLRRRWLDVLAAAAQGGVALGLSRLVRDVLLTRPDLGTLVGYDQNTLPSTHGTVTAGLCAAALILLRSPLTLRVPEVMVAAAVVVLGAFGSVASWAHRPSDVVASAVLVFGVAALTVAAREGLRRRSNDRSQGRRA